MTRQGRWLLGDTGAVMRWGADYLDFYYCWPHGPVMLSELAGVFLRKGMAGRSEGQESATLGTKPCLLIVKYGLEQV